MPEATFVLKEPTSKEPTLIYLLFRFRGERLKYSTGQKISPKFWNEETQRARENRQYREHEELNALLKNLQTIVNNRYRKLLNDKETPTIEKLKAPLNEFLLKSKETDTRNFIGFIDDLIATSNKKASTLKQYKTTKSRLNDFAVFSRKNIEFDSIDLSFYNSFINYLTNEKGYGINTIGATIKNIKAFMNEAVERGLTNNLAFKSKKFKKVNEMSESVYLNEKEIQKLYNLDLSDDDRLDHVRDLFIIGCYTGLRFSDLVQLKEENIIDNKSRLKVKTEKTGEIVVIPLHKYIKQILKKYKGSTPPTISNQKMNEYLKELGELAGIDEQVLISSTKAGKKQEVVYKKYELITSHTARRSFATNAYLNNIPTLSIMKITGHKTEKSFLTYIKMSQEDNANALASHAFFK